MANTGDGRTALVTGASAGIGQAFAEVLASEGFALVLTARRGDRLEDLATTLRARHGVAVHVIADDLADPQAATRIEAALAAHGLRVDLLVNNAGYGVPGAFLRSPWADHARFMQVMMTAVCDLTYRLLPGMIERGWGRVINVASVAGLVPSPAGHTMYGASKAFLIRFSEALHAESRSRGVHVTAVCPGFTHTEFHDVLGTRDQMKGLPAFLWLDAAGVAREGYEAVTRGEAVWVNGWIYRRLVWLAAVAPAGLLGWVTGRAGRSYRKT